MNFGREVYVYVALLHGIRCLFDFELATVSELCLVLTPCYIFFSFLLKYPPFCYFGYHLGCSYIAY